MARLGLEREIVDRQTLDAAAVRLRDTNVVLPTFAELAEPARIPAKVTEALAGVDPDAPHPLNLFRVHWYNDRARRGRASVPEHVVLGKELTGVRAPIVVALGDRFPMIRAHKVLAAYGCLAPRVATGQIDPRRHLAVWPSTGNYCRGGVAIARIMGCRGVAVLPAGMSAERFQWLERWSADPADVIRTPGTESNVKEIYDECKRLAADARNVILNQFCEFGNYLVHRTCTAKALGHVFEHQRAERPGLRLAAFVSATGSAGTLAAGDGLKERYGCRVVAVEALECPTLLYNGFGEHNIQGIGDKHVPFIHNVTNTDVVVAVSDRATDALDVLFQSREGRAWLGEERAVPAELLEALGSFGLSSICNVIAAIKVARRLDLGPDDALLTVATDGAGMYGSERAKSLAKHFRGRFGAEEAAATFARHVLGAATDHVLELTHVDRDRIFNLGYFTWVEQQGVSLAEFEARRRQEFWDGLLQHVPAWDERIAELNRRAAR
jgi:cysteine synthase